MLNKLKKFFEDNEIDFEVRDNELIIPMPCNCVAPEVFGTLSSEEIYKHKSTACVTDEGYLHIEYNEDGFSLLFEIPNYSDEEEAVG